MKKALFVMLAAGLIVGMTTGGTAEDKKKSAAKYTIKQIMKTAMKGGLCAKVAKGGGSEKDKLKLLDLTISLLENKPKKGTQGAWAKKAGALVYASARAAVGRKDAGALLKKAANCGACHKAHKGK